MEDYKYTLGERVKFDIVTGESDELTVVGEGIGVVTRLMGGNSVIVKPLAVIRAGCTIANVRPVKEDNARV